MAREDIYYYCATQPEYDPQWHWVSDNLALGSYPLPPALDELRKQGINAIASVRLDEPDYDCNLFAASYIARVEDGQPFPYDQLCALLRFIHHSLETGHRVYVHCFAGISRSSFVVACYLMLRDEITFGEAVAQLRACRPVVNPHPQLYETDLLDRLRHDKAAIFTPVEEARRASCPAN